MKDTSPVDRTQRELSSGLPETEDHREIDPASGQQKGYVVLKAEERAKGFVRPVRQTYTHAKCGTDTTMGLPIAETLARDPGFYGGTFCCSCREHLPLNEFVWKGTNETLGVEELRADRLDSLQKLVEEALEQKLVAILGLIADVYNYKQAHPEARVSFSTAPGSILNAYREGDLSFNDAVALLESRKQVQS